MKEGLRVNLFDQSTEAVKISVIESFTLAIFAGIAHDCRAKSQLEARLREVAKTNEVVVISTEVKKTGVVVVFEADGVKYTQIVTPEYILSTLAGRIEGYRRPADVNFRRLFDNS